MALALLGCTAVPPHRPVAPAGAPGARCAVVNLTAREWRIRFAPGPPAAPSVLLVSPRATVEVTVPAGHCEVEQVMLGQGGEAEVVRRFPVSLQSGGTYRWPLATLPAESDREPGPEDGTP